MNEKEKIENTDKNEDTKKADKLENEASKDKEAAGEKTKNNSELKVNEEKKETLEQAVNEEYDKQFMAKTIIRFESELQEIKSILLGTNGDLFTASTILEPKEKNVEKSNLPHNIDDKYFR